MVYSLALIMLCESVILMWIVRRENYLKKFLSRLGIKEYGGNPRSEVIQNAWQDSIHYSSVNAEAIFIGDSLTEFFDFESFFPDVEIINYGVGQNNLTQILERCKCIKNVKYGKIFLGGG